MKLDYDCLRDLLITLEEELVINEKSQHPFLTSDKLITMPSLQSYPKQTILYTTQKAVEADLINVSNLPGDNEISFMYNSITYAGHKYLDNIKEPHVWMKVKKQISKVGSASLPIIIKLAEKILENEYGL